MASDYRTILDRQRILLNDHLVTPRLACDT